MKKVHIIILSLLSSFALFWAGCSKLNEKTYSTLSSLSSETDVSAATLGIYQGFFQSFLQEIVFLSMEEGGHKYSSFGTGGDDYYNDPYYDYALTSQEPSLDMNWQMLYNMINRANNVIQNAPLALNDTSVSDKYVAEARFLRGWCYFTLVQFWGKVPLHLQPTQSLADQSSVYKPRSSVDSVYGVIVDDLQFASDHLPVTRPTAELGRATRAAAIGLLGKVYLTMAGKPLGNTAYFQKAADLLGSLVQNESVYGLQLLTDYTSVFSVTNEMNPEILFAFRGNANSNTDVNGTIWPWAWCSPGSTASNPASEFGVRWDIVHLYEPGDVRINSGIGLRFPNIDLVQGPLGDTIYYDTTSLFKFVLSSDATKTWGQPHCGLGVIKWSSSLPYVGWPGGHNKDFIVLRYADVLLCQAEALNEAGHSSDALIPLNRVRNRAGASSCPNVLYPGTDQATVRQAIRDERRRELVGEGNTVFDLRRWGTIQQEISGMRQDQFVVGRALPVYDPKFELYPVPVSELATNPKLLPQNDGW